MALCKKAVALSATVRQQWRLANGVTTDTLRSRFHGPRYELCLSHSTKLSSSQCNRLPYALRSRTEVVAPLPKQPVSRTSVSKHTHKTAADPEVLLLSLQRTVISPNDSLANSSVSFVCTICERLWFQSDLRNAPARAIQWLMLMHLTEEISILRKFKKRCASSHQCTINIQLLL